MKDIFALLPIVWVRTLKEGNGGILGQHGPGRALFLPCHIRQRALGGPPYHPELPYNQNK